MINEPRCPVLLVEDDERLALMIRDFLTPEGFEVTVEGRGDTAVTRILNESPEAVILDVNLPGMDGISVCRAVRAAYNGPILILTARGDEVDEIVCLDVGADDFMSKPVRPRVLLARLRAHLRKSAVTEIPLSQKRQIGPLLIDAGRRTLEVDGTAVDLTTAEFDLLWHLAENVGKVLSREDIYQHIHGFRYDGLDRSIDLRISRLRKKIGDDPNCPLRIKSIRGVGYLLANDS